MSLLDSVNQKVHSLGSQLRDSGAGRFWHWWMAELRALLPASWRARLLAEARPLQIMPLTGPAEETTYQFLTDNDHQLELAASSDPELVQQQVQQLLLDAELENPEKVLFLANSAVLQTEVNLPLAAEGRIRQALEFDLDRQTPFRNSDVYFDYRINRRDKTHNQLHLQLYLVPRPLVVEQIQLLQKMGVEINRVAIAGDTRTQEQQLNLLPEEMRAVRVDKKARFNHILLAVVLVLLAVAMLQSIHVREQYVEELETAIASVSKEARMVSNMRKQIVDAREAAGFLAKRETEYPEDIEVIAELTRILNKDTWVQRLIIKDGEIRVQGLSVEAQRLIRDINASPYFIAAAFLGTTQYDSRAKRERFNLSAKLVKMADREVLVTESVANSDKAVAAKIKAARAKAAKTKAAKTKAAKTKAAKDKAVETKAVETKAAKAKAAKAKAAKAKAADKGAQ
ncbi:MAG: PilN domain-containing protein [Xanthomonadales bacterium]|nr:PilN domain-containing protein [Xanthomonadales bacterium]